MCNCSVSETEASQAKKALDTCVNAIKAVLQASEADFSISIVDTVSTSTASTSTATASDSMGQTSAAQITVCGAYTLPRGAGVRSESSLQPAVAIEVRKQIQRATASLCQGEHGEENKVSKILESLVSEAALLPVRESLGGLQLYAEINIPLSTTSTTSTPTGTCPVDSDTEHVNVLQEDCDIDSEMKVTSVSVSVSGDNSDPLLGPLTVPYVPLTIEPRAAELLSSCIGSCLTAVQRLRSLTPAGMSASADADKDNGKDRADTSRSGDTESDSAETALRAIFGGLYKKPERVAIEIRNAVAPHVNPVEEEGEEGEVGQGQGLLAIAQAPSLTESLALSVSSVATVQAAQLSKSLCSLLVYIQEIKKKAVTPQASSLDLSTLHSTIHLSLTVLPLVRRVLGTYGVLLSDLCNAYKSSGKLLYVNLRIFRVLLAKGLCSDDTKEGEGEGGGDGGTLSFGDDMEGTGMGEGNGANDVSDQIDNEEQLVGLKDDQPKDESGAGMSCHF